MTITRATTWAITVIITVPITAAPSDLSGGGGEVRSVAIPGSERETVQCSVCSVQCAVFSVQCSVCSVHCAVCSVQCKVFSVHFVVCSVQCAVCIVQCTVCSVQCAVNSLQFAVCSVLCALFSLDHSPNFAAYITACCVVHTAEPFTSRSSTVKHVQAFRRSVALHPFYHTEEL